MSSLMKQLSLKKGRISIIREIFVPIRQASFLLKFLQPPKQKEMYYIPPENFLYSAYKIKTKHSDGQKVLEGTATAFLLDIGSGIA